MLFCRRCFETAVYFFQVTLHVFKNYKMLGKPNGTDVTRNECKIFDIFQPFSYDFSLKCVYKNSVLVFVFLNAIPILII